MKIDAAFAKPRGRPPAVPAVAILDEVRMLIARAAGQPCPTSHDIAASAGVGERLIYQAIEIMRQAGELEVDYRKRRQQERRMRVLVDGAWSAWTGWTMRSGFRAVCDPHARRRAVLEEALAVINARGGFG